MGKKRLEYIDITKGLLVLFVILGHLLAALYKELQSDSFLSAALSVKDFLWVPYYMPAFFIITGYCSNFDKPFKQFLIANIKSIKLPAVIFGIIYMGGHMINHHEFHVSTFTEMVLCSPIHCGYWFLDTMFIIKMLHWGGQKCTNNHYVQFTAGIAFAFLGAYFINTSFLSVDYFSICHSLLLYWTIPFGQIIKKEVEIESKVAILSMLGYIVTYMVVTVLAYVPSVTSKVTISLSLVPVNMILSICGTITVLALCKYISRHNILEYCGVNSLIFYCVHLIALSPVLKIGKILSTRISPHGFIPTIIDFSLLIIICVIATHVINKTRLKVILGKF